MSDARPSSAARPSWTGLAISLGLHGLVFVAFAWFAARQGMLGEDLKRFTVTVLPARVVPPPPSAPSPAVEPAPVPEFPPPPPPEVAVHSKESESPPPVPGPATSTDTPRPSRGSAPEIPRRGDAVARPLFDAPPPAFPGFQIGGAAVVATADTSPRARYQGFVEYVLRAAWRRPKGVADSTFLAVVELAIDAKGQITESTWKRGSGHRAWDDAVRAAVASTRTLGRVPPDGFPPRVEVRFDVVGGNGEGTP